MNANESNPSCTLYDTSNTQTQMTVTVFNNSMLEFVAQQSHLLFGTGSNSSRVVGTTRHTWFDSPDGLMLRTQMLLGLMAPGSTSRFDTGAIAGLANPVIAKSYVVSIFGSATHITVCPIYQQHSLLLLAEPLPALAGHAWLCGASYLSYCVAQLIWHYSVVQHSV
jgi:hypothetical protein